MGDTGLFLRIVMVEIMLCNYSELMGKIKTGNMVLRQYVSCVSCDTNHGFHLFRVLRTMALFGVARTKALFLNLL